MPNARAQRRSYRQFCGVARALDVVGERWTLLVVRNLLLGPRRYTDLLRELPGITTNLLAKRLSELEAAGIVAREERPPPVAAVVYALTDAGRALEPVVMELGRWGGRFMEKPDPRDTVNIGWGLLSLKRRYRGGVKQVVELRIDDRRFELGFSPHYLSVQERDAVRPDAVVSGALASVRQLFYGGVPSAELEKRGKLRVEGSHAAWREVLAALAPPPD